MEDWFENVKLWLNNAGNTWDRIKNHEINLPILPIGGATTYATLGLYLPTEKTTTSKRVGEAMATAAAPALAVSAGTVGVPATVGGLIGGMAGGVGGGYLGSQGAELLGLDLKTQLMFEDIGGFVGGTVGGNKGIEIGKAPGEYLFNHLPYKLLDKIVNYNYENLGKSTIEFLRSNPIDLFKVVKSNRFKNLRRQAERKPKVTVDEVSLDPNIATNSSKDGMLSMLSRYKWRQDNSKFNLFGSSGEGHFGDFDRFSRGIILDKSPMEHNLGEIDMMEYIPIKEVFNLGKNQIYNSNLEAALMTPIDWMRLNYNPGFALNSGRLVHINPAHLKALGYDVSNALAHEYNHALQSPTRHFMKMTLNPTETTAYPKGFLYAHLNPKIQRYFKGSFNTELSARGTQLKNYFGIEDGSPITTDMLKYAAKNYVKDTGMDNNMTQFFSGIKDWDLASLWLSRYSLKNGGKFK